MEKSLQGKVALVTGASSGIGKAISQKLAELGCQLVLVGRDEDRLRDLSDKLSVNSTWITADLAQPAQIEMVVEKANAAFGTVDILVPNAGIFTNEPFLDTDPAAIAQMVNVNFTGLVLLTQAVAAQMSKLKSGEILVIGSIAGVTDMRDEAVYSATKHAVNAFIRSLRRQVARDGIRVTSILPGTVATELWGEVDPQDVDRKVADGTVLRPSDIADIAAFMLQRPPHVTIREAIVLPLTQDI